MKSVRVEVEPSGLDLFGHMREDAAALDAEATPADEGLPGSFMEWSGRSPVPGIGELDFDRFPPQRELYSEEVARARDVAIQKATQTGVSENMVRWSMRQADVFGETGIYVFPTADHVREFGDERIEPMIESSDYLLGRIQPHYVGHKSLKQIGAGWLHLRGSRSTRAEQRAVAAQSVAAQFLVFDEYDDLEPRNIAQYERRISGAVQLGKAPRVRRVGVPTIEGFGIAKQYEQSDQRKWIVECQECGERQEITWWENIRWTQPGSDVVLRAGEDEFDDPEEVGEAWRACASCEHALDVRNGEWVAQKPARPVIGFHMTRLIVPATDLRQIVVNSRKTAPHEIEAFWQNDLGLPYSPAEAALDLATIQKACERGLLPEQVTQGYDGPNPVTMGLDVAGERKMNVRISEHLPAGKDGRARRRALWLGEVEDFREAERLVVNFRVDICVVDSNPERRMAKTLRNTFAPGRVILCEYDDRNEAEAILLKLGEKGTPQEGVPLAVRVNRTEAIDAMMDSIRNGRNAPWWQPPRGYTDHLKAPKRRTVEDTRGRPKRVYISTGPDDYAHAEVYDLVASDLLMMKRAAQQAHEQAAPHAVPDEQIGFQRARLEPGEQGYVPGFRQGDDYVPGLGEDPLY